MGEIAEAMIDGELCERCGVYLGAAVGHQRMCGGCRRDEGKPHPNAKVPCKHCGKLVKFIGMRDHTKALHGIGGGGK